MTWRWLVHCPRETYREMHRIFFLETQKYSAVLVSSPAVVTSIDGAWRILVWWCSGAQLHFAGRLNMSPNIDFSVVNPSHRSTSLHDGH